MTTVYTEIVGYKSCLHSTQILALQADYYNAHFEIYLMKNNQTALFECIIFLIDK